MEGTVTPTSMPASALSHIPRDVAQEGGDQYVHFKKLEQQLEFLNTMEDYVVRALPRRCRSHRRKSNKRT